MYKRRPTKVKVDYDKKYGMLTPVKELSIRTKKGELMRVVQCRCDCGNTCRIRVYPLVKGLTTSCGCKTVKFFKKKVKAKSHGVWGKRLYHVWVDMKQRCYNKNHGAYHNYGGAGIKVCKEWRDDSSAFFKWAMNNGYSDNLSLDRINGSKGYSPKNCRFVTPKEQARNRKTCKYITHDGKTMILSDWALHVGLSQTRLSARLARGWTIEKALTTPLLRSGKRKDGIPRKVTDNFR